jgi:membrane dipeptidase
LILYAAQAKTQSTSAPIHTGSIADTRLIVLFVALPDMKLIIDSHLDLAWNALILNRDLSRPLAELNASEASSTDGPFRGHATTVFPEMRSGNVGLCLGTLVAGASSAGGAARFTFSTVEIANSIALGQLNYYERLAARGEVRLIRSQQELDSHVDRWEQANAGSRAALQVGIIIAFEGCDSVTSPQEAELWYERGVRCASLVHYGRGRYAGGTGTEEPLQPKGRELLAEFDRLSIILDLTHLSDMAFAQVVDAYNGPLFASHQNCRTLVPRQRQFTDEQLKFVIDRGGVIGCACDNWMLSPVWPASGSGEPVPARESVPISAVADHIDHVCQLAGNARHAAIGSDLDGGFGTEQSPSGLDSIADLQKLDAILAARGYSSDDVSQIFSGNWLRFFRQHLP